jgi:hypothetical protein
VERRLITTGYSPGKLTSLICPLALSGAAITEDATYAGDAQHWPPTSCSRPEVVEKVVARPNRLESSRLRSSKAVLSKAYQSFLACPWLLMYRLTASD